MVFVAQTRQEDLQWEKLGGGRGGQRREEVEIACWIAQQSLQCGMHTDMVT